MEKRILKDGVFVKNEYGQEKETYLIKTRIEDNDRTLAKMTNTEHLVLSWRSDLSIRIHSANLLGNEEDELPPILSKQTELYFLSVPSHLAKHINFAPFVPQLRGLQIQHGGSLKLRHDVVFENLLYLLIDAGNVYFTKENLPKLRSLSCKYREGLLPALYKYELFDKLTLQTVHSNIFHEINSIKELFSVWQKTPIFRKTSVIFGISSTAFLNQSYQV